MILSGVAIALLVGLLIELKSNLSIGGGGDTKLVETADGVGRIGKTKLHAGLKHTAGQVILFVVVKVKKKQE